MAMAGNTTTPSVSDETMSGDQKIVAAFVEALPDRSELEHQLRSFVVQHASHHRPVVLVTSGGTAADLEVNSVRCLDNFSTGTRGAISVEEFLKRGYAVIHLWRNGSASPYGRIVSEALGMAGNAGPSVAAVGKLFAGDLEDDVEDQLVQSVLAQETAQDPWLTDPSTATNTSSIPATPSQLKTSESKIHLHRRVLNSSRLQVALKERQSTVQEGRLLTIPFRSIDEYLAKLQLCSQSLDRCQALAMLYLVAAVSDFYIPPAERSHHKIQSADGGLTLTLAPVPKVMGWIRHTWAPNAFVCSFKLETKPEILRQKAEQAIQKYGCHMVVGNTLETRYEQVQVLVAPPEQEYTPVQNWPLQCLTKSRGGDPDDLERQLIDAVVQAHFDYISSSGVVNKAGAEALMDAQDELERQKRQFQHELWWRQVRTMGLEWAGVAVGALLSYAISSTLRKRMNG